MTARTLPREPWRGSMICGWQIAYGLPRDVFCGEPKAPGRPFCAEHAQMAEEDFGPGYSIPGDVALGAPHWATRLLWEGDDPDVPVEPTGEETAAYAALYGHVR